MKNVYFRSRGVFHSFQGASVRTNLLVVIRKCGPWLVTQIVGATSLLFEDSSLRRRIGQEARHLIEEGEFT